MSVRSEEGCERAQPPCTLDLKKNYNHSVERHGHPQCNSSAADLRLDLSIMEQRKRVTNTLQSPDFKDELECVVREQGSRASSSLTLNHIADIILNNTLTHPAYGLNGCVSPVNDVCVLEWSGLCKAEKQSRCKLASLYRLLDLYGYTHFTKAYATVRVSKELDHVLILPQGLAFSEATAASLAKVDLIGQVVDCGSSGFNVDVSAYTLHAALYSARPDTKCVIHTHTPATAAVSSMKCGILPISHEALLLGEVAYFSYHGDIDDGQERMELQKALGPNAKVMVLRNHGLLAFGETVEEAFHFAFHTQQACEIQVSALSSAGGVQNLCVLDRACVPTPTASTGAELEDGQCRWRVGEAEFESLMRMMDNLGFRTGHAYRHPIVKMKPHHHNDVEIPATVTGVGQEEQEPFPWSSHSSLCPKPDQKRTRWLHSPNTYTKLSVQDDSNSTTWRRWQESDGGTGTGTPIKIENPNQFVPLDTDPAEVLEKRNMIRDQKRVDVKWAGPKSHLLANIVIDTPPGPAFIYEDEDEAASLPPNPFIQTQLELQEYTHTVQNKLNQPEDADDDDDDESEVEELTTYDSTVSLSFSPLRTPDEADSLAALLQNGEDNDDKVPDADDEDVPLQVATETQVSITTAVADSIDDAPATPNEGQNKSPKKKKKKKKKFHTLSFLRKSKKKEKEEKVRDEENEGLQEK